ncbi:MAG: CYTH domain-containing protein [Cellvibrionales bacterium]|nr:CYTH domain-containing protein [Cellvibrionales bacterium]
MPTEIERRFLVRETDFLESLEGKCIAQGYLNTTPERTVRVRIRENSAWLTIKSKRQGIACSEFEYAIPLEDAKNLLHLSETPPIEKERFSIHYLGSNWEIDVFKGENSGLVIAEIELASEDQTFKKPEWLGKEISSDTRYYNSMLSKKPFLRW